MINAKKNWTAKDVAHLEKYVFSKAHKLVPNLYKNILVGYVRFAKPYGFFSDLGKLLAKSASQVKAKFHEMEQELYVEVLSVELKDFAVFVNIRRQMEKMQKQLEPQFSRDPIDILSRKSDGMSVDRLIGSVRHLWENSHSMQYLVEDKVNSQINKQEIQRQRLRIMHLFLQGKLGFEIKNKGKRRAKINFSRKRVHIQTRLQKRLGKQAVRRPGPGEAREELERVKFYATKIL